MYIQTLLQLGMSSFNIRILLLILSLRFCRQPQKQDRY